MNFNISQLPLRLFRGMTGAMRLCLVLLLFVVALNGWADDDTRPIMSAQYIVDNELLPADDVPSGVEMKPAGIALPDFPFKMDISNGTIQLPFLNNDGEEMVLTFMAREWQSDPVELTKIGVRKMNGRRFLPVAVLNHANITTCQNVQHPHYSLRAATITLYALIDNDKIDMGKMLVTTRGLGVRMLGIPLPSSPLPLVVNLSGIKSTMPIPSINFGSNSADGQYFETKINYRYSTATTMEFESRFGTEHFWRGKLSLSQPFQLASDGVKGNITLLGSRGEDVSVNWLKSNDGLDKRYLTLSLDRLPAVEATTEPINLLSFYPACSFRFGTAFGVYHEIPTDISNFRSEIWGILRAPLGKIGPFDLTAQLGLRAALADDELLRTYQSSISASSPAGKDYTFDFSYIRRREGGSSPFLFDRLLVKDEIYSAVGLPIAKSSFGLKIAHRYDLEAGKSRSLLIMPTYHDDCFLYGLSYDPITSEIRIGLELQGFGSFRDPVPGVQFKTR